jgi:hypothetical protein
MCAKNSRWRKTPPVQKSVGNFWVGNNFGEKAKGRSRKPLAEVILESAPLRATSSATPDCNPSAIPKRLKTGAARAKWRVGIANARKELLSLQMVSKNLSFERWSGG